MCDSLHGEGLSDQIDHHNLIDDVDFPEPVPGPIQWAFRWSDQRFHVQPRYHVLHVFCGGFVETFLQLQTHCGWKQQPANPAWLRRPGHSSVCLYRLYLETFLAFCRNSFALVFVSHLWSHCIIIWFIFVSPFVSLFVSPFSAILLFLSFAICLTNEPSSSPTRDQGDQDDCDRNHQRQWCRWCFHEMIWCATIGTGPCDGTLELWLLIGEVKGWALENIAEVSLSDWGRLVTMIVLKLRM